MKIRFARFALLSALIVTGCLGPHLDWNTRIGHYTYDQAIVELGPPDKNAKLSDGRTVAEWVTITEFPGTVTYGPGYYNDYPARRLPGQGVVAATGPTRYENRLRLTFTPDNVLSAWTRN